MDNDSPGPPSGESPFEGLDDVRLLPRLRTGDAVAYRYLCDTAILPLFQFAYHIVRTRDAAEDAVHAVLAEIWVRRAGFAPVGPLRAYLYRSVRNHLLNVMEHERVVEFAEATADSDVPYGMGTTPETPDTITERADTAAIVAAAIRLLPERQRTAILLRWYDMMTTGEVAQVMGISRQVAERLLHKAEAKLRITLRNLRAE